MFDIKNSRFEKKCQINSLPSHKTIFKKTQDKLTLAENLLIISALKVTFSASNF